MTTYGPRLTDSPLAEAFLADLTARPQHVVQGISNALDALAELPFSQDWVPADQAETDHVIAVYVRGVLAAGLLYGQCRGHHIFYTPPEPMAPYGEVGVGVLLRAHDALVSAMALHGVLLANGYQGFHGGHLDTLSALTAMMRSAAAVRLGEVRERGAQG